MRLTLSLVALSTVSVSAKQAANHGDGMDLPVHMNALPDVLAASVAPLPNLTQLENAFFQDFATLESEIGTAGECDACLALLTAAKAVAETGDDNFDTAFDLLCNGAHLEDADVCAGLAKSQGPVVAETLRAIDTAGYQGTLICAALFNLCPYPTPPAYKVPFPKSKPDHPNKLLTPFSTSKSYDEPLTVLHLSDLHIDPLYKAGSEANCTKPMCCRAYADQNGKKPTVPAPSYGSFQCDVPLKFFEDTLKHQIAPLEPDFTIITGDFPPHDVWLDTPQSVISTEKTVFDLLHKALPHNVFYGVGNHEVAPVNQFQPDVLQTPPKAQYLFNSLQKRLVGWVPQAARTNVSTHRGSYYARYTNGKNKLKVISMNDIISNYVDNFYLYQVALEELDVNHNLNFLVRELQASEDAGERVWIIGHMPQGVSDALQGFSSYFEQVIQRYWRTISGQFYGHTHNDQFEIHYSDPGNKTPKNAISVSYIAPSLTPFTNLNAGYRVYKVDPVTFNVLDTQTFITNVSTFASLDKTGGRPKWNLEYNARSAYSFSGNTLKPQQPLTPSWWAEVADHFATDSTLFGKYFKYFSKSSVLGGTCDATCQSEFVCAAKAGNSQQNCVKSGALTKRDHTHGSRDLTYKQDHCRPSYLAKLRSRVIKRKEG